MLVNSKILVQMVIEILKKHPTWKIIITASHRGTSGAPLQTKNKYGFSNEETWSRVMVREAVDELNKLGYNVDQSGIDEHEQDLGFAFYAGYDLVISNHFNSAGSQKLTMYNPPTKWVAEEVNAIRNSLTAPLGIAPANLVVGYYRGGPDMLYMVQAGKAAVLLEWFAADDNYDVDRLLSQASGDITPTPQKPSSSGTVKNGATINENGTFVCKVSEGIVAHNSPHSDPKTINGDRGKDLEYDEYIHYDKVCWQDGYVWKHSKTSGMWFATMIWNGGNSYGEEFGHSYVGEFKTF